MIEIKKTVIDGLKASKGDLFSISAELKIPYPTLLKIGQGAIKNPGINHVEPLYNFFINKNK